MFEILVEPFSDAQACRNYTDDRSANVFAINETSANLTIEFRMVTKPGIAETKPEARKDGRRPFMLYLDPALIKAVKRQALDKDIHAYELVEGLLREHLDGK